MITAQYENENDSVCLLIFSVGRRKGKCHRKKNNLVRFLGDRNGGIQKGVCVDVAFVSLELLELRPGNDGKCGGMEWGSEANPLKLYNC